MGYIEEKKLQEKPLIERAQAGDQKATQELYSIYNDLIANEARKWSNVPYHDADDLMQVGRIGFLRGLRKFNISSGLALSTYVTIWIFRELSKTYGKTTGNSKNSKVGRKYIAHPLEESDILMNNSDITSNSENPENIAMSRSKVEEMLLLLPSGDSEIFNLMSEGHTLKEISNILDTSDNDIQKRINSGRKKLRAIGNIT
jgi:RNA polymerase sigma factor (sigma-70 family)